MNLNNTDKFIYDVFEAYLKDHNIVDLSAVDLITAASCRYRDNRIFVRNNLRDMLLTRSSIYKPWNFKFSRSAVIFTILYSVRKQYPDCPEFWVIQELDNRVYPIVRDEFNPLIMKGINNSQFSETIEVLIFFNDINAFESFINEEAIRKHLHGRSVYQEIIDLIGENIEFKVVFMRAWNAENPEDESNKFRL